PELPAAAVASRGSRWYARRDMKVGLLDIGAAGVVLTVILLPTPSRRIDPEYVGTQVQIVPRLAEAQAELARAPADGAAANRLASALIELGETDLAMRISSVTATQKSPTTCLAMLGVSEAHAARFEIRPAYDFATRALEACEAAGAECADYQAALLRTYV